MKAGPACRTVLLALGFSVITSSARADQAQAKDFARRAERRIAEGDRHGAIEFMQQAFEADSDPGYILWIGEQWEALAKEEDDPEDLTKATAAFERYVTLEKNPDHVTAVRRHLDRLKAPAPSPPLAAPSTDGTMIRFQSVENGATFQVSIAGKSCTTPCQLPLHSGAYTVTTTGSDNERLSLYVANTPGTVMLKKGPDRFILPGAILTGVGAVVATTFWTFSYACPARLDLTSTPCQLANETLWPFLGGAAFFTGVGFLGYYATHQQTEADFHADDNEGAALGTPRIRLASLGVQPLRDGVATMVGFTF